MRAPKTSRSRFVGMFACLDARTIHTTVTITSPFVAQRGYAVDIERDNGRRESESELAFIRPRPFSLQTDVGASDRAVRKYRQDLIPNRSQQSTASINNLHAVLESRQRKLQPSRSAGTLVDAPRDDGFLQQREPQHHSCTSRDCFQCSNRSNLLQSSRRSKKSRYEWCASLFTWVVV